MTSGGVVGWEKAEDVPCSSLSNYHFVPRDDYTRSLHTPEARGGVQWASIIIRCVLQFIVNQVVISWILKLNVSF